MDSTRAELAAYIDHTLLKTEATDEDVAKLAAEAVELGTFSICVSPNMLPVQAELGAVKLAVVCGFPSGKHTAEIKAAEARAAVAAGADEVDMVIDVGLLRANRYDDLVAEIAAVKAEVPGVLKVIIESAKLDSDEIVTACQAAEQAGADYVKTSTGFDAAGGASVEAVRLMAATVGGRLGVKASGGIRDYETAMDMIQAGATRLGCSATAAILDGAR